MPFLDLIPYAMIPIIIIVVIKLIIHLRQNKDDQEVDEDLINKKLENIGFKGSSTSLDGYHCDECEFETEEKNIAEARMHWRKHHKK